MKKLKQLGALVLALMLAVALCCPAVAASEGSITIDNAVPGKTYTVYRMFDLDSHSTSYDAFTYKVSTKWSAFFAPGAKGRDYVSIDSQGYVTEKEGISAANFAADAVTFATENKIAYDAQSPATTNTLTFSNLELGYYLVQSDLGALCALDTAKPDVTMKEKNSNTTIEKQVQEDSTGIYGATNDADIGQTVNFQTTINVLDGTPRNYKLHDKMSAGLTFRDEDKANVSVKIGDRTLVSDQDYTLTSTGLTDGCTFEIAFTDSALKANDVVTVSYSAMLNENAVIAGEGNPNDTRLTYGDKNETKWSQTRTYVWSMDVFKYAMDNGSEKPLAGAQFALYKMVNGEKNYVILDSNKKVTGWTTDVAARAVISTPDNGKFTITGLDADTYFLEEVEAPAGYNKLAAPIEVVISASIDSTTNTGTPTVTYDKTSTGEVKVLNQTGSTLPTTGGMGTTVLYVVGGALVVCAGVALVAKKRMQ